MDIQQISLDRIEKLHPKIKDEVKTAYLHVNKKLLGKGIKMGITQGLRTFKEQDALYNKKPKVTNAKGGQSLHNYGLAFDFAIYYDNDGDGIFEELSWSTTKDFDKDGQADWMVVVKYFKSIGFEWGGDWTRMVDKPHFQKVFGYTWQRLLEKYNKKEFIEGGDYVKL